MLIQVVFQGVPATTYSDHYMIPQDLDEPKTHVSKNHPSMISDAILAILGFFEKCASNYCSLKQRFTALDWDLPLHILPRSPDFLLSITQLIN